MDYFSLLSAHHLGFLISYSDEQTSVVVKFCGLTERGIQNPDKKHTYVEFGLPEYDADTCEAEDSVQSCNHLESRVGFSYHAM